MAPRFSRLILAFVPLSLSLATARAQDAGDPRSGRQVFSADALRRAGLLRVGDLVTLGDRWALATVDGIAWQVSPTGQAPLDAGRWSVLVDGQPIDLDVFGTVNLNRLAMPLQAIDSVELIDAPSIGGGELTLGGVLHIHTSRPSTGLSLSAWGTTGSEIGDPGPFAFTPRSSANVDRFGHEYAIAARYGGRRWWADASVNVLEHPPTDPALVTRYIAAAVDNSRIRGTAPGFRVGGEWWGGTHELTLRFSRLTDFLNVTPLPGPVAALERFAQIGLAGRLPRAGGIGELRYAVSRSVNRGDARLAADPSFDFRAVTWTVGLEAARGARRLGARFRHVTAGASFAIGSLYGEVQPFRGRGFRPEIMGALTLANGETGGAAVVTQRWAVLSRYTVRAGVGYMRRLRAEDHSIWAWSERGFTYLADAGIPVTVDGPLNQRQELAADIATSALLGRGVRLDAVGQWRQLGGITIARQDLHYDAANESFEGPTRVTTEARGQMAGLQLNVAFGRTSRVQGDVGYRLRGVVAGREDFRDAARMMPRHVARGTLAYLPVPGFDLQFAMGYRSGSEWIDYRAVETESAGRYRATVPEAFTIDVSAQKRMWDRRLRLFVGVRNLVGAPLRYHPAGATWSPALVLQAEALVP